MGCISGGAAMLPPRCQVEGIWEMALRCQDNTTGIGIGRGAQSMHAPFAGTTKAGSRSATE